MLTQDLEQKINKINQINIADLADADLYYAQNINSIVDHLQGIIDQHNAYKRDIMLDHIHRNICYTIQSLAKNIQSCLMSTDLSEDLRVNIQIDADLVDANGDRIDPNANRKHNLKQHADVGMYNIEYTNKKREIK